MICSQRYYFCIGVIILRNNDHDLLTMILFVYACYYFKLLIIIMRIVFLNAYCVEFINAN